MARDIEGGCLCGGVHYQAQALIVLQTVVKICVSLWVLFRVSSITVGVCSCVVNNLDI